MHVVDLEIFVRGGGEGGGGVQTQWPESSMNNVCFSSPHLILQRGSNGYITEKTTFRRIQRGSNIPGGSNFFQGGGGGGSKC